VQFKRNKDGTLADDQFAFDQSFSSKEFEGILKGFGIPAGVFRSLIDQGVRQNWTTEELLARIYGTKAFKRMFPGIFRKDGSLRMSPLEYRHISDVYNSVGNEFGINLSKRQLGRWISRNVSMQEARDRFTWAKRLITYKPSLLEFREVLKANRLSTKGLDTDKELIDFVAGRGSKQLYDLYEQFNFGLASREAGLNKNFDQGFLRQLARQTPGFQTEEDLQRSFQSLARQIRTTIPLSKIHNFGLNDRELAQLEFGGPRQAEIAEKVRRVLLTEQASRGEQFVPLIPQAREEYKARSL
jgi:hypothetical protein